MITLPFKVCTQIIKKNKIYNSYYYVLSHCIGIYQYISTSIFSQEQRLEKTWSYWMSYLLLAFISVAFMWYRIRSLVEVQTREVAARHNCLFLHWGNAIPWGSWVASQLQVEHGSAFHHSTPSDKNCMLVNQFVQLLWRSLQVQVQHVPICVWSGDNRRFVRGCIECLWSGSVQRWSSFQGLNLSRQKLCVCRRE